MRKGSGRVPVCHPNKRHQAGGLCKPCYTRAWQQANKGHTNEWSKEYHRRMRLAILEAYGNRCVCCGEESPYFLSIDHVNNDGAADRKNGNKSRAFYRFLIRNNFPSDYQLLCMNCNWGKQQNGGVCPHQNNKEQGSTKDVMGTPRTRT
jgi:hypothetical protein